MKLASPTIAIEACVAFSLFSLQTAKAAGIRMRYPKETPKRIPNQDGNLLNMIDNAISSTQIEDAMASIQSENENFIADNLHQGQSTIQNMVETTLPITTEKPTDQSAYCPEGRYEQWSDLPRFYRTRVLYYKLGYTASTWNFEPSEAFWNPLEDSAWNSTIVSNVYDELEDLGYDEDKWDCCINHYEDFDWDEFVYWNYTEQIEAHEALGWTQDTYGSANATLWPASEFLSWKNLTEYQQFMAASKLCYTEETWDESLALSDWPEGFAIPDAW